MLKLIALSDVREQILISLSCSVVQQPIFVVVRLSSMDEVDMHSHVEQCIIVMKFLMEENLKLSEI